MPRLGISALAMPVLFAAGSLPAERVPDLAMSQSAREAYREALDGVMATLPPGSFEVADSARFALPAARGQDRGDIHESPRRIQAPGKRRAGGAPGRDRNAGRAPAKIFR